jgi:hypothetical protein
MKQCSILLCMVLLEVCDIRSPGAPGPVYDAYLQALRRFIYLVLFIFFVFIVVLSFGEALRMSATNQTLATLAGGLLPIAMRMLRRRNGHDHGGGGGDDDVNLSMLSFQCRLFEVLANFRQSWPPVCDFEFEPQPETEASAAVDAVVARSGESSVCMSDSAGGISSQLNHSRKSSLKLRRIDQLANGQHDVNHHVNGHVTGVNEFKSDNETNRDRVDFIILF